MSHDALEVVVVGSGIAGTAAALAASRAGASVTVIDGGVGASAMWSGAIDDHRWEGADSPPAPLSPPAHEVIAALDAFEVPASRALVATTAGCLRPARGMDRAVLDLTRAEGKTVVVPLCDHRGWDAEALARTWNASPFRVASRTSFIVVPVALLRHDDEHHLPDAELAARHDDALRISWLCERIREACADIPNAALILPPWLGVEREAASALRAALGIVCGEAIGAAGGPSGLRFERARDRALATSGARIVPRRASRVAHRPREDRRWRVDLSGAPTLEADSVVLATGGVLGGGIEYTPGQLARATCDIPGSLGAHGRALEHPSSMFGAAPERHAWPHVVTSLMDVVGLMVDAAGQVAGAPTGLYAAGEIAADRPHTWLAALEAGARAGSLAANPNGATRSAGGTS